MRKSCTALSGVHVGRLVKFHRGGVVLKSMLCATLWIC